MFLFRSPQTHQNIPSVLFLMEQVAMRYNINGYVWNVIAAMSGHLQFTVLLGMVSIRFCKYSNWFCTSEVSCGKENFLCSDSLIAHATISILCGWKIKCTVCYKQRLF